MKGPLHFESYLRPMVWGGRRLAELGKVLPGDQPYGEAWEISDHASHSSRVQRGPHAGQTLRQLMHDCRAELLGRSEQGLRAQGPGLSREGDRRSSSLLSPEPWALSPFAFPLLVKLLDAKDWLSVQVHPDDEAVRRLWPGEGGKTEAWFVLDAAPGSRIYAGLRPGVDETQLRQALERGRVADCLHSFTPRSGDCLFLRAGTVHAVGGGVLMAEVQQTSDATFRLFDWNRRDANGRSRELHVEQALACIDWKQGPVQPISVADPGFQPGACEPPAGKVKRQTLVECPYFTLEYLHSGEPFACGTGRARLVTVVRGAGRLETASCSEQVDAGETWLLPASAGETWLKPQPGVGILLTTLPLH